MRLQYFLLYIKKKSYFCKLIVIAKFDENKNISYVY